MEERNELETLGKIVATEEPAPDVMVVLDQRIRHLEMALGELLTVKAQAVSPAGRKTVPAETASFSAKAADAAEAASVDDALRSLGVEQRIAVKSGLMRAGLL